MTITSRSMPAQPRSGEGAGPDFELPALALVILEEGQVGEGLIADKFLLLGVLDGQGVIGAPCAGVDVELVLFVRRLAIRIERDDLMLMRVPVDDEMGRVVEKGRLMQGMLFEGTI